MMLKTVLANVNNSPVWRRHVKVWDSIYTAPSLDRLISLQAHRFGWMGSAEKRFLRSILNEDSIVADVGANQGLYTLWLARVAARGYVYAFEPDPDLFQCLKTNIRNNRLSNIAAIKAAASNHAGTLSLRVNPLNRGDNRASLNSTNVLGKVQAVTIDEKVTHSHLDLLKLDVQGFEIEVLQGAQDTLSHNPNLTISFEFWPYGLRQAGHNPIELFSLIRDAGFSIRALGRNGRLTALPEGAVTWKRETQYCNLIASRQKTL